MPNIRAGTVSEVDRHSGDWVFVDMGFASEAKSCGFVLGDGAPRAMTFSDLRHEVTAIGRAGLQPLNLLLEAPLSVAFGANGNPTGRSVESRPGQSRYWYVGLGCSVLVAATYLLRSIHDAAPAREVRLFEGLVSFKTKGGKSSHTDDVEALRELAWAPHVSRGKIIAPEHLARRHDDQVISAFRVAGMDFGVPPVVAVGA